MAGFVQWWGHIPEHIDPYIVHIGSFRIGWYGMMYLLGALTCYLVALYRIKRDGFPYKRQELEDFIVWTAVGMIVGARLGYVLFYNFGYYARNPLEIILPFRFDGGFRFTGISGMSYHGGAIGIYLAGWLYMKKRHIEFWGFSDFFTPAIPLGYTWGRLGNFINGELYGRPTDSAIGMYFPADPTGALRHPSQLYEAFFEGIFLFAVLWAVRKKSPYNGFMFGLYIMGYGIVRFFIEFFRAPDSHLGFVLGPFSMGQVLCFIMMAMGASVMIIRRKSRPA